MSGWCRADRCFDPRPRTGGDQLTQQPLTVERLFRSAPPHGGRHAVGLRGADRKRVSIRAPARGATAHPHWLRFGGGVSIRAPARGATAAKGAPGLRLNPFRSAPPHGGRPRRVRPGLPVRGVSIRAPARGATSVGSDDPKKFFCFDPRPRTGGDARFPGLWRGSRSFDPRPRTGGDRCRRGF